MIFRIFLLAVLTAGLPLWASACDACGCGVGGGGFGLLSIYRNNFVGLNYGRLPFKSQLTSGEYTGTEDIFSRLEIQARYEVIRGVRVDLNVAYLHNSRTSLSGDQVLDGPGDIRLGVAYVFVDNRPLGDQGGSWYLEAGAISSLPTGAYENNLLRRHFLPDNFNLGKGAMGGGLQGTLVLNSKRIGVALNAHHLRYAESTLHHRFGAETSIGAQAFGQFARDPHWKFIPSIGLNYERVGANTTVDDLAVHGTGGRVWLASAGANVRYDDVTLSARVSHPIDQDYSDGLVEAGSSFNTSVLYNF